MMPKFYFYERDFHIKTKIFTNYLIDLNMPKTEKNHGKIRVLSKPVNNICNRVEFIADIFFIHSQEPDQNDFHILLLIKESTAFDNWDPFTNRD